MMQWHRLASGFTKLEELIKEADEILGGQGILRDGPEVPFPFLPIIIIQGHDWHFLTAIRLPHKQTVRVLQQLFPNNV